MERIPIDTDADPQSSVGVGQSEQGYKSIYDAQPSWLADGYGIRGPQQPRERPVSVSPIPMEVGMPAGRKSGGDPVSSGACAPTAPPDDTDNYVWMTIAGECQWIPVCEAECGATVCGDGEGCV